MSRRLSTGVAVIAIATGLAGALAGGYALGRWHGPVIPSNPAATPAAQSAGSPAPAGSRPILYYQDPSGKPEFSPEPKKDAAGVDFVAVYGDPAPAPAPAAPTPSKGKILYYRNPMGLPDTSKSPKKDPMGMDYVPVYEGDEDAAGTLSISPAKIQKLGVRTEAAALRPMIHTIRAVGTVELDERRISVVAPKFEGYVQSLAVNTTGQEVKKGEALFETYSPDLVLAQQEYLAAWQSMTSLPPDAEPEAREAARGLVDGALQRLRNWDISDAQLRRLQQQGRPSHTMTVNAPTSGIVLEKTALQGARFMPGEALYRIADLGSVWVIAQVYEQELPFLRLGQTARLTFAALPGASFEGPVSFISPVLSGDTRTMRVRIELPNPQGRLKPSFYGTVSIESRTGADPVLAVPDQALIDSGARKVVLVDLGNGRFEPRAVKTGLQSDGFVQILDGLVAGDQVVVTANFLIDAESNLRAALQSFHGN